MALFTKRGSELPEGAVAVSKQEALAYQKAVVRDWPRQSEVAFLKYGSYLASATTFISSGIILNKLRTVLNVRSPFLYAALTPTFFVSSYVSSLACDKIITDNVLLMKFNCPLCSQLKFALLQSYFGFIFPVTYGIGSYVALAYSRSTYNFESALKDPKLFWKEIYKIFKRGTKTYQLVGILHIPLVLTLPYLQAKELSNITKQIKNLPDDEFSDSSSILGNFSV